MSSSRQASLNGFSGSVPGEWTSARMSSVERLGEKYCSVIHILYMLRPLLNSSLTPKLTRRKKSKKLIGPWRSRASRLIARRGATSRFGEKRTLMLLTTPKCKQLGVCKLGDYSLSVRPRLPGVAYTIFYFWL